MATNTYYYYATVNQMRTDLNANPFYNGGTNVQTPNGLSCTVCDTYTNCYDAADSYKNSSNQTVCAYYNNESCDITGAVDSPTYNGTFSDWYYHYKSSCGVAGVAGGYKYYYSTVDPSLCTIYDVNGNKLVGPGNSYANYNSLSNPCGTVATPCSTPYSSVMGLVVTWRSNDDYDNEPSSGRYMSCQYGNGTIANNYDIITQYYSTFLDPNSTNYKNDTAGTATNDNNSNYNLIMGDYATGIATESDATCPTYSLYPYTGQTPSTCNRMISIGSEGTWVNKWLNGLLVPSSVTPSITSYSDQAMNDYCAANINAPECQCINRATVDDTYNQLLSYTDAPPACWYIPCQTSNLYLIPSSISNVTCDYTVCKNIENNIALSGGTITSNEQQVLSCSQTQTSLSAAITKYIDNGGTVPTLPSSSPSINIALIIVITIIGIIILGVIIFIGIMMTKKK